MCTERSGKSKFPKGRPFMARVTLWGEKYFLGYYSTCKEACDVEQTFRFMNKGKALNAPGWVPPEFADA